MNFNGKTAFELAIKYNDKEMQASLLAQEQNSLAADNEDFSSSSDIEVPKSSESSSTDASIVNTGTSIKKVSIGETSSIDPNATDEADFFMHCACITGDYDEIKKFIIGALANNCKYQHIKYLINLPYKGYPAINWVLHGHENTINDKRLKIIAYLLKYGANITRTDVNRDTFLHKALECDDKAKKKIFKLLLKYFPNINELTFNGKTAIMLSQESKEHTWLKELLNLRYKKLGYISDTQKLIFYA